MILQTGGRELKGKGMFKGLDGAFADANVFANADLDSLVCQRTGKRRGF